MIPRRLARLLGFNVNHFVSGGCISFVLICWTLLCPKANTFAETASLKLKEKKTLICIDYVTICVIQFIRARINFTDFLKCAGSLVMSLLVTDTTFVFLVL